jgi:EpsI family protein
VRAALPVLLAAGLALLPLYLDLAQHAWREDANSHGPLVLLASLGLIARAARAAPGCAPADAAPGRATRDLAMLVGGLLLLLLATRTGITALGVVAQLPIFAALAGLLGGAAIRQRLGFPLAFLLFMVPLPAQLITALTGPLKIALSGAVVDALRLAGYPAAHSGVILLVDRYQLLVADACSGLHSLLALTAMAALYLHLTAPARPAQRRLRIVTLLAALLPLALAANALRILGLALTTVQWGDAAGQRVHAASGGLTYLAVLAGLAMLDRALFQPRRAVAAVAAPPPARGALPAGRTALLTAGLIGAALMNLALAAADGRAASPSAPPFIELPARFNGWTARTTGPARPNAAADATVIERHYEHPAYGEVMVSLAQGGRQRGDDLQLHRPEFCYAAQGFTVTPLGDEALRLTSHDIPVRRVLAERPGRAEAISYWLTVGDQATLPGVGRKLAQLRAAFRGEIPAGMLLRVSSLHRPGERASALHDRFLTDFLAALPPPLRTRLTGPSPHVSPPPPARSPNHA